MFGLGLPEIIVILIVALLVVGPSKLPEFARSLGKAFNDFRRMADEVKETIEEAVIKEEPSPEEPRKEDSAKESTPDTEAVKEQTAKDDTAGMEAAKAEDAQDHELYGKYPGTEEAEQVPDAQRVAQDKASGGDRNKTETKA